MNELRTMHLFAGIGGGLLADLILQDVLIVGYDGEGELMVRSSRMDRKDALWLAELLRNWAINGE